MAFRVDVVVVSVPEHCVMVAHVVEQDWLVTTVPLDVAFEQITLHDVKGSAEQELDELEDIEVMVPFEVEVAVASELSTSDDMVEVNVPSVTVSERSGVLASGMVAETDGSFPFTVMGGGVGPGVQPAPVQCVVGHVKDGKSGIGGMAGTGGGKGNPKLPKH